MPILKNPRHERFAQELATGRSAFDAYANAGYRRCRGHASRLAANGSIRARVNEILGKGAEMAEVTVESLLREAAGIQRAAMDTRHYSAATGALIAKAKLAGLWAVKSERTNYDRVTNTTGPETNWSRSSMTKERAASELLKNGRGGEPR